MFKLGSFGKVKSLSLAWDRDMPKNDVWAWVCGKAKKLELGLAWLGLTWLISQAKLKLNIKLKLELMSSFWAWDLKKLHYVMLKSLKLRKKKKKIVYSFYHAPSPTYD